MAQGPSVRQAEFSAGTVDEAVELGLRTLGLAADEVEIAVVRKGERKGGFFRSKAVVSIAYDEETCRRKQEEAAIEKALTLRYAPHGFTLKVAPVPETLRGRLLDVTVQFLVANHVPGFDRHVVERLVEEQSGEPHVIFEPEVVELAGARASLYFSPSEMEAYYLQYDQGRIGRDVLDEALARKRIVRGLLDAAVEAIVTGSYTVGLPIVVARGKPPRDDLAPAIEYQFDLNTIRLSFKEDSSVDFRDVMRLSFTRQGDVLVRRGRRTGGEAGWTVTGEALPFEVEPEAPLPGGRHTAVSNDGTELRAAIDGHIEVHDGLVCVEEAYVVKGDVDYHTGNVHFDGSVIVGGDVLPEFEVKAKGNVEIFGSVDDAVIEAGGDVTVQFGIVAKGRGRVTAEGEVRARHFENVTVSARRIAVASSAVNCRLHAREIVEATGNPGTLVGGVTTARDAVVANSIGSELGTRTEIIVGDPAESDAQIKELKRLVARKERELGAFVVRPERASGGNEPATPPPERGRVEKELLEFRAKLLAAEEARRRLAMAKCHVFNRLYDGTCVRLFTAKRSVTEDITHSTLLFDKEQVRPFPFQYEDLQDDAPGRARSEQPSGLER